jgi:hypothetical protein
MSVFVVTMRAIAGPKNAEPDGRLYDLLVFARAETEDEAEVVAYAGLKDRGWDEGRVIRTGEITDPDATPEDLRPAMLRAERDGCALIVYDLA